jgi:hypothetical protein
LEHNFGARMKFSENTEKEELNYLANYAVSFVAFLARDISTGHETASFLHLLMQQTAPAEKIMLFLRVAINYLHHFSLLDTVRNLDPFACFVISVFIAIKNFDELYEEKKDVERISRMSSLKPHIFYEARQIIFKALYN